MSDDLHASFTGAPVAARWKGRLDALFIQLQSDVKVSKVTVQDVKAGKGWYWRVLPHGAVVALRKRPDVTPCPGDRMELRIARSGDLNPEVESRWQSEVRTFLKHFEIRATDGTEPAVMPGGCWLRLPPEEGEVARPVARFLLLMQGEVKPGIARCHACRQEDPPVVTEVEWSMKNGLAAHRCNRHTQRERAEKGAQTSYLMKGEP